MCSKCKVIFLMDIYNRLHDYKDTLFLVLFLFWSNIISESVVFLHYFDKKEDLLLFFIIHTIFIGILLGNALKCYCFLFNKY